MAIRCDLGSVFKPEELAFYYDRCPICNSEISEFNKYPSGRIDERAILRICMLRPARKNIAESHMVKSHFVESISEITINTYSGQLSKPIFSQIQYVRQPETHQSKFLVSIQYRGMNKKTTSVEIKNTSVSVTLSGWWKPPALTVENYKEVYNCAKRLLHFT